MTPKQLTEIESRANAATAGPWESENTDYYELIFSPHAKIGSTDWDEENDVDGEQCAANGDFIAHARADVPALIAEVRRLRVFLDYLAIFEFQENSASEKYYAIRAAIDGEEAV
jgi:hypothetical protein